mgnify:CR=1 FL=1
MSTMGAGARSTSNKAAEPFMMKKTKMTSEVLRWTAKVVSQESVDPPTSFRKSFADGLVWLAMLRTIAPSEADRIAAATAAATAAKQSEKNIALLRLNLVFDAFSSLGVPKLLDAEDMLVIPNEERSVATYCIELRRRWDAFAGATAVAAAAAAVVPSSSVVVTSVDNKENNEQKVINKLSEELEAAKREIRQLNRELDAARQDLLTRPGVTSTTAPQAGPSRLTWLGAGIALGAGIVFYFARLA